MSPSIDRRAATESLAREVAHHLGLRTTGTKVSCCCVFHDDSNASAVIFFDSGRYWCSACGESRPIVEVADGLGVPVPSILRFCGRSDNGNGSRAQKRVSVVRVRQTGSGSQPSPETRALVADLWGRINHLAVRNKSARADMHREPVLKYLKTRGLAAALDEPELIGVLPFNIPVLRKYGFLELVMELVVAHRLCCALYDSGGDVVSIQGRNIRGGKRHKTYNLPGIPTRETMFANAAGRRLLRGDQEDATAASRVVIVGEGLSDFLALSLAAVRARSGPVLSAPGAGQAASGVGSWARARKVLLALDGDDAGRRGMERAAQAVRDFGGTPYRVTWPEEANDACDVVERIGVDGLGELVKDLVAQAEGGTAR